MTNENASKLKRAVLGTIGAMALLGGSALAQQAATPPPVIASTEPVNVPTTQPYSRTGTYQRGVTTAPGGKFQLNFQNADINNVLDELSSVAGFIVIKDVHPVGRITLQTLSNQPMSRDDVISALNTVLKPNYAAIRQDRVLKIVDRNNAKYLNIPVHSGSDPEQVADTDELITQVIPLRQADATQLKTDLAPLVNPDASFTANASSNALIITDTSSNIKRIVEIVSALDGHLVGSADVKVFSLNYASATTTAQLINDLFGSEESGSNSRSQQQTTNPFFSRLFSRYGGGGGFPGSPGGAPGAAGQAGAQGTRQQIPVKAAADDRTNMLAVAGPTDTLNVIAGVIKELDANPAAEQTTYVYRLKNADATNMQGVLNALFNGTSYSGTSQRASQLSSTVNGSRAFGSSSSGGGLGGSSGGRSSGLGGSSGSSQSQNRSSGYSGGSSGGGGFGSSNVSAGAQAAAAALAGQVTFIADTDTNSLVVRTAPKNYPQVRAILDDLDRDRAQVLIKVLIAEVTHNDTTDLGAELSAINLSANGNGEKNIGTSFGLGSLTSGFSAALVAGDFNATVHALESVGKVDVLSRPYILASDNQEANITVGQEVPFVNYSQTTDTGNTINNVEYSDIGIIVDVIPHINPDGLVLLDIAPQISSLTTSNVQVASNLTAPIYNVRSAQSEVAIRDGQTIVIGGLMQDQKNSTVDKVPLLGDIPIIGQAFQHRNDVKTKTELLIFLTPHVARQPEMLKGMSDDELRNTKLVPGAVYPGAFDEHRRGLERGGSAPTTEPSSNVDAIPTTDPFQGQPSK